MYDGYRCPVLKRLVTPRWLGALLLAGVVAVACYNLGWWQYHRHEAKVERNERIAAHYTADPVPVESVLTSTPLPTRDDWTRVVVEGEYVAGPLYVRGRPQQSTVGYEVLWVLRPTGGLRDVLVDRGWVAQAGTGADVLPEVAPAPDGPVTVVGWAHPGEEPRSAISANGSLGSISLEQVAEATGLTTLDGYVQLETETLPDGSTPPRPQPLGEPDRSLGPHLAYAYQWWFATVVGFVLVGFGIRREERLAHPEKYPPKETKVRIWDEEDA
jgi:cytochrome oxidase assembly protein ShyY1